MKKEKFSFSAVLFIKPILLLGLLGMLFFFAACSDDSDGTEYLFDREILEMSVLNTCAENSKETSCIRLRFRYPIETEDLEQFLVWIDTTVIDDTTRSVSSSAKNNATLEIPFPKETSNSFDTLDLTEELKEYSDRDSVQVAIWPEYSDSEDPGAVQRIFVHFGDNMAPAIVSIQDSVWSNGAAFDWSRPTDQVDYYAPENISGPIAGYNVVVYALNESENIKDLKVSVQHNGKLDSIGETFYFRNARFRARHDSVWLDSDLSDESEKRYLRLAVIDGEGFSETDSLNRYRLVLSGLKPESRYTIGITAFDSSGNYSGASSSAEMNQMFITTDKVAPVMPTSLYFIEDSLNPGMARLDSNNRVRLFWSRSVDPFKENHGIVEDSVLAFPDTCYEFFCYRGVESYEIDRLLDGEWVRLNEAGGKSEERYLKYYEVSSDTMQESKYGTFVTDTIRWVSPGDTLILRIRSVDSSGYYSRALIDTVNVSPGPNADLNCPPGFLPISLGDTVRFCMERFEHADSSGAFMTNLLHSEALDVCESISASGFEVSLCGERDWELVCLTNGISSYGVIEENVSASEYLYTNCNVATNDSISAASINTRNYKCANASGVRDLPGQYQEWVLGKSTDSLEMLKGSSYRSYDGLDRESIALCTNRFFPFYTRKAYVKDTTVYLYRSGTVVDTSLVEDTTRTLYKKLMQKDFRDSLQFFAVKNPANGEIVGYDYAPLKEYRQGGEAFLEKLAGNMEYEPDHIEVVFFLNGSVPYKKVGAFYKNVSIGFRCCAYPQ